MPKATCTHCQKKFAYQKSDVRTEPRAHRLLCGEATSKEDVARLVVEPLPILMATDAPYGVQLDQSWRDRAGMNASPSEGSGGHYCRTRKGNRVPSDPSGKRFASLDTVADWSPAYELVPSLIVAYVWHASAHALEVETGLRRIGFEPLQQIIWHKEVFTLSRSSYHWMHEPCFYVRRKGKSVPWYGPRDQHTVWQAPSPKQIFSGSKEVKLPHPCQKPILLFRRPIENHLQPGEVVFDPFLGSGTCMAAAEETGRVCYGMELVPEFAAVCLERMKSMGLDPQRVPAAATEASTSTV
jgi:hypothetical protein